MGLANFWKSWYQFRRGKTRVRELEEFSYYLEGNLQKLWFDTDSGSYQHGPYRTFAVTDNKRRRISVASIRDRVVHRLLYEYLVKVYDKTFYFDVWSCRKNKGLTAAIARTQSFLNAYPRSFVWRADITKFFDNVNSDILIGLLDKKIPDPKAAAIIAKVINSYPKKSRPIRERERERESKMLCRSGIPIGNLTSQIFANIYLNEFDRFVTHQLKPIKYLRYGDDFIILSSSLDDLKRFRLEAIAFLKHNLKLNINPKSDIMVKARQGVHFLGVELFPKGRRLNKRNWSRINSRLDRSNVASYHGLVCQHANYKKIKEFNRRVLEKLREQI